MLKKIGLLLFIKVVELGVAFSVYWGLCYLCMLTPMYDEKHFWFGGMAIIGIIMVVVAIIMFVFLLVVSNWKWMNRKFFKNK